MKATFSLVCLICFCALMPSCSQSNAGATGLSYKCDTVLFVPVAPIPPAAGPQPNIHIDTNVKMSSMFGGTIKTSPPYSIGIDYSDETFTYAEAEFTKLVVTYNDGTDDPGATAQKLPLRFAARPYEATNSVAGGRIEKTRLLVISGKISGVISQDKPFTLQLEGNFIKNDGSKIPFAIKHKYEVQRDKSIKSWSEVMSGC